VMVIKVVNPHRRGMLSEVRHDSADYWYAAGAISFSVQTLCDKPGDPAWSDRRGHTSGARLRRKRVNLVDHEIEVHVTAITFSQCRRAVAGLIWIGHGMPAKGTVENQPEIFRFESLGFIRQDAEAKLSDEPDGLSSESCDGAIELRLGHAARPPEPAGATALRRSAHRERSLQGLEGSRLRYKGNYDLPGNIMEGVRIGEVRPVGRASAP
jgi:hypothetical protein